VKAALARTLPIIIGVGLGMLIMYPPGWLRGLGWLAYVVTGSTALILLVGFVALLIAANLPREIALTPVPERPVPAEVAALAAMMLGVGYTLSAANPLLLGVLRDWSGSFAPVLWCIAGAGALLVLVDGSLRLTRSFEPGAAATAER
jgi:cyanate permease